MGLEGIVASRGIWQLEALAGTRWEFVEKTEAAMRSGRDRKRESRS
jgi:hypothetical protein